MGPRRRSSPFASSSGSQLIRRASVAVLVFAGLTLAAILALSPRVAPASGGHDDGVRAASFLAGCAAEPAVAQEALPDTSRVASVLEHTEHQREMQDRRATATARQEARASGHSVDRLLEIAIHPMFLLFLAVPLLRRLRAQ